MKKYFKPHIVEIEGKYYIRKYDITSLQWEYLDDGNIYKWWISQFRHNCAFSCERYAIDHFQRYKDRDKITKIIKY